ncbi:MAG TPA: hypothetical protein VJ761_22025 [Ktedonobacteraceae bacterium]|nr:hypothetical protein [Ktedonobacteraceae bacterium]
MNQKIDLHIGELILRDVPYALRHRIAAAVEQELARLLSEQELPPSMAQDRHILQIDTGTMQLAPDAKPDAIGTQIAQSVYDSLVNTE